MKEIHRILKPNGKLVIRSPYFVTPNAYTDLTHKRFFTIHSFDYFDKSTCLGKTLPYEVKNVNFKIEKKKLIFPKTFRILGVSLLAKINYKIYEEFFAHIFLAREVYFELRAIK
jgi:SAM-dependent methyltransferase